MKKLLLRFKAIDIKALPQKLKALDYRHYICIAITLGFVACAVFVFPNAFGRLIEAFRDIGTSSVFYYNKLSDTPQTLPITVNELTKMPFTMPFNLPNTWEEFKVEWSKYWQLWASESNLSAYFTWLAEVLRYLCKLLLVLMPFVLVFVIIAKLFDSKTNNNYNKDTALLVKYKQICKVVYAPTKKWVCNFIQFIKDRPYYWKTWLWVWAYNFNIITIMVEFVAFYLYFVSSFDLVNIYRQVIKLFMDLSIALDFIPLFGWLILAYIVFNAIRKRIGYARLNHFERRNRGFINERPIVMLVCGTMGKKKTTMITDMALSQEIMFRDTAFEKLLRADLKFPFFPWINLENCLKRAIDRHSVYNLATCRRFVNSKRIKYCKRPCRQNIFMYDYKRYGYTYNDKLQTVDIWKVIEDYTQLYFIYIVQSSLILSNYSIRTDNTKHDIGNLPMWDTELFRRDSRLLEAYSRHSHILDFDALRLGKRMVENNVYANSFEFGVVLVTEIGKERGNNLELQEKKKNAKEANQKNDLFNSWLKMVRHSATVDNFPFVKIISDEQRPDSWGADARDLCEIVYIKESCDTQIAMPFFSLASLVCDVITNKFKERYANYRYRRGDNTLPMYLYHGLTAKINDYNTGKFNTFGYCKLLIQVESGTRDGILEDKKYYLMFKKIYSKRFATDCYSDFYMQKALKSLVGLEDLPEYKSVKATVTEFLRQNSYFMADLLIGLFNNP